MSRAVIGHIDQLDGNDIVGWVHAADETIVPQLFVNGRPATLLAWPTPRPDVAAALGTPVHTGFRFAIPALPAAAQIDLYAVSTSCISLVQTRSLPQILCETNPLLQLEHAKRIATQKESVAIACWEGSHNPIGRATVLYNILRSKRSVIIFTYLFDEFGGSLWLPAAQADIHVVTIPWNERQMYHQLIRNMHIRFDTIWICKPRVPSFQIASMIGDSATKYILDIDDNESAFSRNEVSQTTAYGALSESLARYCTTSVPARTTASVSLQREFGGELVRHARNPWLSVRQLSTSIYKRIAFIGTARTHKGILAAAQAIRTFNTCGEHRATLHVYGDIPASLKQQLEELDVQVQGHVAPGELFATLAKMDAAITGFPVDDPDALQISNYQISSKISDALAVGIPVLVPESPSVADLSETEGIYIFTKSTFVLQCRKALSQSTPVVLPPEFTLEGAYKAFLKAEQQAQCTFLPFPVPDAIGETPQPTLVLLWKQHDAGLYGRRVDQIARSYRVHHPDHRVIILELLAKPQHAAYAAQRRNILSDAELILGISSAKLRDGDATSEGIHYCMLHYESEQDLHAQFLHYIVRMHLIPSNTTFVSFPFIEPFSVISTLLAPFPLIVDFVDNQLFWATSEQRALAVMAQYAAWARMADHCLFNSDENLETFRTNGVLPASVPVTLIPNWYSLPSNWQPRPAVASGNCLHVVYSGNMNDRVDWSVLENIADSSGVTLHLIGAAQRVQNAMTELVQHKNVVYHGPKTELETLKLLRTMDVAIIPHCQDNCSKFMNPIKVCMYKAVGIPIISLRISGIADSPGIEFCSDGSSMLLALEKITKHKKRISQCTQNTSSDSSEQLYMRIIDSVRINYHK